MPRPNNKRKAGEIDFDDPMSFVADYCRRNGLPDEAGGSLAEKECAKRATEAREDYKEKQDAASNLSSSTTGNTSVLSNNGDHQSRQNASNCKTRNEGPMLDDKNDRRGLSPAQKYSIRLQNNRKSAYASKVYNEVFKRELSSRLRKLDQSDECPSCSAKGEAEKDYRERILAMKQDIESLQTQLKEERQRNSEQQTCNEELNERIKNLAEQLRKTESAKARDGTKARENVQSEAIPVMKSISESIPPLAPFAESNGSMDIVPTPQDSPELKTPSSPPQTEAKGCGSFPQNSQLSLVKVESQGTLPPSQTLSFHHRLMNSRFLQSFSSPTIDTESKDFHTGLTCTQSQNDDAEDKGQLLRNLPSSGGIPVGLICSQPSQSEIGAAFKSSLGSEDLQMGEPELFLSSQGTNGSLTKAT